MVLYGIIFFLVTIIIQYILHRISVKRNNRGLVFWTGYSVVLILCLWGIVGKDINYFMAIAGFVIADNIGKILKWHS